MGRNRFVVPNVVRLPLSDGDWIEVKERLTVGEARRATQSFVGSITSEGARTPNTAELGLGQVLAYLVDWSFRDANDKPVSVSFDAIKALDIEAFREIDDALDAHITRVDAEDAKKKTTTPGSGESKAIS